MKNYIDRIDKIRMCLAGFLGRFKPKMSKISKTNHINIYLLGFYQHAVKRQFIPIVL